MAAIVRGGMPGRRRSVDAKALINIVVLMDVPSGPQPQLVPAAFWTKDARNGPVIPGVAAGGFSAWQRRRPPCCLEPLSPHRYA